MKTIILDYGMGNLRSVLNALAKLGVSAKISADPEEASRADLLIMPGQGAFGAAITNLKTLGLDRIVKNHITAKKPFLGICVGFQLLFEDSEEKGFHKGLGIFPGSLKAFDATHMTVPHMGWNQLDLSPAGKILIGELSTEPAVYFVHSFYVSKTDSSIIGATTTYGVPFISMIQTPTLLATQFHPEKSGDVGMQLLKNFLESHA